MHAYGCQWVDVFGGKGGRGRQYMHAYGCQWVDVFGGVGGRVRQCMHAYGCQCMCVPIQFATLQPDRPTAYKVSQEVASGFISLLTCR